MPKAETLRIPSAEMPLRRTQRTEEDAGKLTITMLVPIPRVLPTGFMVITVVLTLRTVARVVEKPAARRGGVAVHLSTRGADAVRWRLRASTRGLSPIGA